LAKYANEELILNLLPVLDNVSLAETHLKDEGISQIKKQFLDLLKKEGIEPMKTLYEKFDPNYMEVVEEVDARDASHGEDGWKVEEPGIVVEVVQEGFTLHGKIIRVAKVKISK
jgi:molecular chaperone GrpE